MSRYHSYLNTAVDILNNYYPGEPFSIFLKRYFSAHKKFGSKDRKVIAHLCYCYFRLGKAAMELKKKERVLAGLFLCSTEPDQVLEALRPEWNSKTDLTLTEKIVISKFQFSINDVFPWKHELSNGIDHQKFSESFFIQPDLFLRLRPGREMKVKRKLEAEGIRLKNLTGSCLALTNASKIDTVVALDEEAVIQDYSSQQVGGFMHSAFKLIEHPNPIVWDCCAASGGKSIMAYDLNNKIDLTVSDIRETILVNLKKRFKTAGIKNYKAYVTDLASKKLKLTGNYDLIIADVPCSGSGTWSRTPEELFYFNENLPFDQPGKIEDYSSLQKKIVSNIIPCIKKNGYLLYITCSVFKKENEEVVDFICKHSALKVDEMQVLKGYDKKADTMFAALLSAH